jgi:hypothetical protein
MSTNRYYPSNNNLLLQNAILEHFATLYSQYNSNSNTFDTFIAEHLFFITVSFRPSRTSQSQSRPALQLRQFGKLHFHISKYILGNNLNRKRREQPLTYAFVDCEGSRFGSSDPYHCELPHVHALSLVRPRHLEKFREATFEPRLRASMPSLKNIQIELFSPLKGNIENLISYSMKGHRQTLSSYADREDLWALFPR